MILRMSASLPALTEERDLCLETLDTAADLGLKGVEIKLGRDNLISPEMREWLGETLKSYGFTIYGHLPYLHGPVNLAASDEALALRAGETLMQSVAFISSLGGRLVNTHLGVSLGEDNHVERALGRLRGVRDDAQRMGVEISIENQEVSCAGIINTPTDVEELLSLQPDASLTYDPGHGNTHGFGVEAFLPVFFPRLRYLHLHDNNGLRDEHLVLGEGNLNLRYLFLELGRHRENMFRDIPAVLELAAPDLEPSIRVLGRLTTGSGLVLA